jgi:hypothetical protein
MERNGARTALGSAKKTFYSNGLRKFTDHWTKLIERQGDCVGTYVTVLSKLIIKLPIIFLLTIILYQLSVVEPLSTADSV